MMIHVVTFIIGMAVMAVSMIRGFESEELNRKTLIEYLGGVGIGALITIISIVENFS